MLYTLREVADHFGLSVNYVSLIRAEAGIPAPNRANRNKPQRFTVAQRDEIGRAIERRRARRDDRPLSPKHQNARFLAMQKQINELREQLATLINNS